MKAPVKIAKSRIRLRLYSVRDRQYTAERIGGTWIVSDYWTNDRIGSTQYIDEVSGIIAWHYCQGQIRAMAKLMVVATVIILMAALVIYALIR